MPTTWHKKARAKRKKRTELSGLLTGVAPSLASRIRATPGVRASSPSNGDPTPGVATVSVSTRARTPGVGAMSASKLRAAPGVGGILTSRMPATPLNDSTKSRLDAWLSLEIAPCDAGEASSRLGDAIVARQDAASSVKDANVSRRQASPRLDRGP